LAALIKHNNPLGPPHNPPIALVFRLQQTLFLPLAMLLPFPLLPQLMNSMLLLAQASFRAAGGEALRPRADGGKVLRPSADGDEALQPRAAGGEALCPRVCGGGLARTAARYYGLA
jgi:hypothetical protein